MNPNVNTARFYFSPANKRMVETERLCEKAVGDHLGSETGWTLTWGTGCYLRHLEDACMLTVVDCGISQSALHDIAYDLKVYFGQKTVLYTVTPEYADLVA